MVRVGDWGWICWRQRHGESELAMGEIVVDIQLENDQDRTLFERGFVREHEIRNETIPAVADTGAMMLALPQDVVSRLGLEPAETIIAMLANGTRTEVPVVKRVSIRIGTRQMLTEAMVIPTGADPSIGQIVMERLDLIADCANQTLHPRPESLDRPLLRL